ncbi:MAG: type II toxin-antitoxin system antitoxin SocA domain-containing protein, partial [Bacteroidota bacterium]
MNEDVLISNWIKDENSSAHEVFEIQSDGNMDVFTLEERETIETIIRNFKDISSWDLVDLSHQETAWKELETNHELISYQEYAFEVKGVTIN